MKNKELFEKTTKILIDAFMNETLAKGDCAACAVGNMVAANIGCKPMIVDALSNLTSRNKKKEIQVTPTYKYFRFSKLITQKEVIYANPSFTVRIWGRAFYTSNRHQKFDEAWLSHYIVSQTIKATGYNYKELMRIEKTFETNTRISLQVYSIYDKKAILEDQFNGLMAVMDVLMDIHECDDNSVKEDFKNTLLTKIQV